MNPERWQKIKSVFDAALEVEDSRRPEFLDEACAGDTSLRSEIQKLLDSFGEAESFIEQPAVKAVASLILEPTAIFENGQRFGHYEIVRQIGAGGMGEVYLAKDNKLGRHVAIKILNQQFSRHESNLKRFILEAKAASGLNHPNILVIHEIGADGDVNYIVSEYVEGKTLRDIIRGSNLKPSEILDIAMQISGALAAAHGAGIVHRDIKPENIVIRPDGYVKILDFGLAKLIEPDAPFLDGENEAATHNHTAQGVILGTVNYMSPEQAKGEKVDERTDIFSLGVVMYEMTAGKSPFAGDSMSETFANLINAEPTPLARFGVTVTDEFQKILNKSLRKKREDRYQKMHDLFAELKTLQKRLDFEAEFDKFGVPSSGGGATQIRTEMLDFQATGKKELSGGENSIAVMPFTNISNDAGNDYFCDGLAEELLNALATIKDLKVAARTSAFSFKGRNANVSEIGSSLNVNTILEGSVRKSEDRLRITIQLINASNGFQIWSERYDGDMKDIFDLQDKIALAVIDKLKVKFLSGEKAAVLKRYTENPKAYEYYLKGIYYRWKLTPDEFGKCFEYFQKAVDADPDFALAHFGVASYYGYGTAWGLLPIPLSEGWDKAEAAIAKTLELDKTLPEVHLTMAAFKLVNHRDWKGSGKDIERIVKLNPKFPEIHHLYSFYLLVMGRFDAAISEAVRALELDPLSLNFSRFLGICYFFSRQYDKAIEQFQQAIEFDPNNISLHELLGGVFAQKGMFNEAVASWQTAFTLEGDTELASIIESDRENFAGVVKAIAQKRIERMTSKAASGEFVLAIQFARAYIMLGDDEKAFHWLEKAVDEHNVFPLLINSDPFYDRLRSDPNFYELLKQMNLE